MVKTIKGLIVLGVVILLIIAALWYADRSRCPGEGNVIVSRAFIDSLRAVAEMPPDTVTIIDTIRHDRIVYVDRPVPVPEPQGNLNIYRDSLINDEISVWATVAVEGIVREWSWAYRPVEKHVVKHILIPKPYPVFTTSVEPSANVSLVFSAGAGVYPIWGVDALKTTKNGLIYGGGILRYHGDNIFMLKFGKSF